MRRACIAAGGRGGLAGVSPDVEHRHHLRQALDKGLVESYYEEEAQKVLEPVRTFLGQKGIQLQTISKVGHVGETIAAAAEADKYDLLVMGSHGHGALATLVLGSITTQVLANSRVPVLVVR